MPMEWIIAIVVLGFVVVVAVSRSVTSPVRWLGLAVFQLLIGALLLFFANLVGEVAGFRIPINPVTALLAGFLRIPGLLALVAIKLFIL